MKNDSSVLSRNINGKIPLIVVCGPTASGKTALAVSLAGKYGGEVVSADSMQVYKYMDIGTAKPSEEETGGVPHHLIDILEPSESFSAADYVRLAGEAVKDIRARGRLPILAGGTGLYISSFVDGLRFPGAGGSPETRERLQSLAREKGNLYVWEILNSSDPELAQRLHPNNMGRIIRAIETFEATGVPMSRQQKEARERPSGYIPLMLGLGFADRQKLYDRINYRVDKMISDGLVSEAEALMKCYSATASQAIGYKELAPYFEGKITLDGAVEKIKQETRRYAKRQLTWFRRDSRIKWFNVDEYDYKGLLEAVCGAVDGFLTDKE